MVKKIGTKKIVGKKELSIFLPNKNEAPEQMLQFNFFSPFGLDRPVCLFTFFLHQSEIKRQNSEVFPVWKSVTSGHVEPSRNFS